MACDPCKTRWWFGENLISSWKHETEAIWAENVEKYRDYKEINGMELLDDLDDVPIEPTIASQSEMGHNASVDPTSLPPQSAL